MPRQTRLLLVGMSVSLLVACGDEDAVSTALSKQLQLADSELSTQNYTFTERLSAGRRWACVDYTVHGKTEPSVAMAYRVSSNASWAVLDLNSTATACDAVRNAVRMIGVQGLPAEMVDALESMLHEFSDPERIKTAKTELAEALKH